MGQTKDSPLDGKSPVDVAEEIAIRSRLLYECDLCGDYKYNHGREENAYKLANMLFTDKDSLVKDFKSRQELTDAIQYAMTDYNHLCHCRSLLEKELAKDN